MTKQPIVPLEMSKKSKNSQMGEGLTALLSQLDQLWR